MFPTLSQGLILFSSKTSGDIVPLGTIGSEIVMPTSLHLMLKKIRIFKSQG